MQEQNSLTTDFLSTGVPGLDDVLAGGLTCDRLYLVEGEPGTGKTTLALQFLTEGLRRGESSLYVTLAETAVELRSVAQSHGWDMAGIHIEEIIPDEQALDPDQQYTIFHPSEIELGSTTQRILAAVDRHRPRRVVLDSLSELQLLAESPLRYRR
jgi:circadian clock protein KaiC